MLVDFLELPWEDVHELACKLEHFISEAVADRIAHAMNYPTTCPHGNPIDATFKDGSRRLAECEVGSELTVAKISDERLEFLSYVMDIGLMPGYADYPESANAVWRCDDAGCVRAVRAGCYRARCR